MTIKMRIAVASAALTVGAFGAPAAHGAGRIDLAGTTVISGSRAAYADVRVPRAVTLATTFGGGDVVAVSGGAGVAAFVLVGTGPGTRGVTIAGGASSVSDHVERFLMPVPEWPSLGGGTFEYTKTYANSTRVPAGHYRLYFVSSGRASITVRMPGLSGKRTIAPGGAATGHVVPADHELTGSSVDNNVFAATNNAVLKRRGFGLQVLQSRLEGEAAWQVVMCHNNPAQSAAEPLREAPGCPAGEKHTFANHRLPSVEPDSKLFAQAYAGLPAGEHGLSVIYTSEANATAIGYSAVWLEY